MDKDRPEGWKNPYEDIPESVPRERIGIVMGKGIGYEEGADALIEAGYRLPSKDYNFSPIREADVVKPSTDREAVRDVLECFCDFDSELTYQHFTDQILALLK